MLKKTSGDLIPADPPPRSRLEEGAPPPLGVDLVELREGVLDAEDAVQLLVLPVHYDLGGGTGGGDRRGWGKGARWGNRRAWAVRSWWSHGTEGSKSFTGGSRVTANLQSGASGGDERKLLRTLTKASHSSKMMGGGLGFGSAPGPLPPPRGSVCLVGGKRDQGPAVRWRGGGWGGGGSLLEPPSPHPIPHHSNEPAAAIQCTDGYERNPVVSYGRDGSSPPIAMTGAADSRGGRFMGSGLVIVTRRRPLGRRPLRSSPRRLGCWGCAMDCTIQRGVRTDTVERLAVGLRGAWVQPK